MNLFLKIKIATNPKSGKNKYMHKKNVQTQKKFITFMNVNANIQIRY